MLQDAVKTVAFISSFPPRRCGIATFSSDLIKNISNSANGRFSPLVVSMLEGNHKYTEPVKFEIRPKKQSL